MNVQKKIRSDLRKLGITTTKRFPRFKCRRAAKESLNPHWAIKESFGFVILNIDSLKTYNNVLNMLKLPRLRTRNLDKKAMYRFPRKAFHLRIKK